MVDTTDLSRASALNDEKQTLGQALANLDASGPILNMTIGGDNPVTIATDDFAYPMQMVDAIKAQIRAKQEAIEKQLVDLGVGGLPGSVTPSPLGAAGSSHR